MTQGLQAWLDDLSGKPLPIFRDTKKAVTAILDDEKGSSSACRQPALDDPGLAVNLISGLNRERLKANRQPITTISGAISLMGIERFKQALNDIPNYETLGLTEAAIQGAARCLKQRWYTVQFAMQWAKERGAREPEEIELAAALQCLPELMLWVYGGDVMPQIEHRAYYQREEFGSAVQHVLGCDLRELGAALAKRWALPELVCFGFESDFTSHTMGTAVALAANLSRITQHYWYGRDMDDFLPKFAHYLGQDDAVAARYLHRQALQLAETELEMEYPAIAARLAMIADDKYADEMYRLSFDKGQRKTGAVPQAPADTATRQERDGKVPDNEPAMSLQQRFNQDVEQLKQLVKEGSGFEVLIKHVLHSLCHTLKLKRVAFVILNQQKDKAMTRLVELADAEDDSVKKLNIALTPPNLFSQLLKKPQAFWLNRNNYEKYWAAIPGSVKQLIQTDAFFTVSVFYGDKAIGFIYADAPNESLSASQFKAYQQMTLLLNKALAVLSKHKK